MGVAVGVAAGLVAALISYTVAQSSAPNPIAVSVSIDARHPGVPVARTFLGLSFELTSLRQISYYADRGDMVALLRSLGSGVLRFGGASADTRIAWADPATPRPAWASAALERGDLRRLGRLAARSGWRILLTIGLAHYDPRAAAREARAAKTELGRSLAGIELGNEPDAYARHGLRSAPWTFARYRAQVEAYRRAIAHAAPGLALAGPDVSGSRVFERWGRREATHLRPALLTGHHYPLGCHELPPPTVARLLSPQIRRLEGVSARRYVSVSDATGIRFRLDETNTVSCGGRHGISDSFASALWAVDYIARAMAAGMTGINLQGNPANCHGYTPLCASSPQRLAAGTLKAEPEWYALLLDRALIGDRPVPTIISSPSRRNLDVTTLLAGDGRLHFVIVDDDPAGAAPIAVRLHVGARFGAATILALTAPSASARSGVQLAGRVVQSDGSWRQPTRLPRSPNRGGTVRLPISPSTAVLVTVAPGPGANG